MSVVNKFRSYINFETCEIGIDLPNKKVILPTEEGKLINEIEVYSLNSTFRHLNYAVLTDTPITQAISIVNIIAGANNIFYAKDYHEVAIRNSVLQHGQQGMLKEFYCAFIQKTGAHSYGYVNLPVIKISINTEKAITIYLYTINTATGIFDTSTANTISKTTFANYCDVFYDDTLFSATFDPVGLSIKSFVIPFIDKLIVRPNDVKNYSYYPKKDNTIQYIDGTGSKILEFFANSFDLYPVYLDKKI